MRCASRLHPSELSRVAGSALLPYRVGCSYEMFIKIRHFSRQHIQVNLVVFYIRQGQNKFCLCAHSSKTFQASLASVYRLTKMLLCIVCVIEVVCKLPA